MNHFLNKSAQYIFNQHNTNELAEITVILPTRRGAISFKKELAIIAGKPIIAPNVIAIEDFILQTTRLQLMEPIDLIFELFNSIKKEDEQIKFELFMSWAPTLLKDFESIDQYLVNAKQLFSFMTEAKAMERWNITEWATKNPNFETSVEKYFALFKTLYNVYENFNKTLITKGIAYRGSAYRYLAENVKTLILDNPKYGKYYFLGFNALSLSESKIVKTLIDAKIAEILWDTDDYYMQNSRTGQLAGKFLKENKKEAKFGTNWQWQENNLLENHKNIAIIGVPNTSLQPIVAANYLNGWAKLNDNKSTALILADETCLDSVLSQIPDSIGKYNITMGLSIKVSPIYSLFETIFEIQQFAKIEDGKETKFNTRLIVKLLNHNLIKKWNTTNSVNTIELIEKLQQQNLLFLNISDLMGSLKESFIVENCIEPWQNSPKLAINNLQKIIKNLSNYTKENSGLENQYIYYFSKTLNRIEEIVNNNPENININGLKSILFEILRQTKLPFESNATDNLQIMGMLETRTLDFERIIILSANEGNLPAGKKAQSLIPFEALMELNMPTYGHQDAIMAYHFFRLLQQPTEIVIIYTEPNPTNGNKEKSRFILQIEHELAKLNKNIALEYPNIELIFAQNTKTNTDFEIEKTEAIASQIKKDLVEKGLFATQMNEFIRCEMLYYFNRIAKIKEPNEIDEFIGNDIFGTWVHKTLENIDREIIKNGFILEKSDLVKIKNSIRKRLEVDFEINFPKLSNKEGMNLILLNVAEKVLTGYFNNEIENGEFPQKILAIEESYQIDTTIKIENELFPIKIGGKIDKIVKIGDAINIIDYKTGKVEDKSLKINDKHSFEENIENILNQASFDKFRQLWLYRYLFLKKLSNNSLNIAKTEEIKLDSSINAGIYSFRNNKAGFMKGATYFSNEFETANDFLNTSEKIIEQFVGKLIDQSKPFKMTNELKTCEYCIYKGICNR